jgi:hypothetical protein
MASRRGSSKGACKAFLYMGILAAFGAAQAGARPPLSQETKSRPADLATQVEGVYAGAVISDARGSSRSDVRMTVTRTGPNRIRVTSDYARLPPFEASLSRYMNTIQNVGGDHVFLFDTSKSPPSLDITIDDASWSGTKEGG